MQTLLNLPHFHHPLLSPFFKCLTTISHLFITMGKSHAEINEEEKEFGVFGINIRPHLTFSPGLSVWTAPMEGEPQPREPHTVGELVHHQTVPVPAAGWQRPGLRRGVQTPPHREDAHHPPLASGCTGEESTRSFMSTDETTVEPHRCFQCENVYRGSFANVLSISFISAHFNHCFSTFIQWMWWPSFPFYKFWHLI